MSGKEKELSEQIFDVAKSLDSVKSFSKETEAAIIMSSIGDKCVSFVGGNVIALVANICAVIDHDPEFKNILKMAIELHDRDTSEHEQKCNVIPAISVSSKTIS